ncbi:hypothetical protein G0U57_005690, partial [Chelydra serpentina]
CTACLCRLARDQGWEAVTCPFCRTPTSLRVRDRGGEAGTWRRRSSRRRLALPPVDPELWKRIGRREGAGEAQQEAEAEPGDDVPEEAGQSRLWRALKKFLRGGSRSSAGERQPIN